MERRSTYNLIPYPRNTEFFDDIAGEAWTEFLESVRTSGVIEPVVITHDNMIVSGHQRVRACRELGIADVPVIVREYDGDDSILKELIETNIRQRGVGNTNPVKFGRCIRELERIYGIQQGNNQYVERTGNNFQTKTQEDLASELGIGVRTLLNYKTLASAIPEIQTLIETGVVTPTAAIAIVKKLSSEEQKNLAEQLNGKTSKTSKREIDRLMEQVKQQKQHISELEAVKPEPVNIEESAEYKELQLREQEYIARIADQQKELEDKDREIESLKNARTMDQKGAFVTLGDSAKLYELCKDVEDLLNTQLAPLKYQRYFQQVSDESFSRETVRGLIDCVSQWCLDMEAVYNRICKEVVY